MAIVSSKIGKFNSHDKMGAKRLVDPLPNNHESSSTKEEIFRPKHFDDFIGQVDLKEVVGISVKAALSRAEALDHVLLYGPPGLGKTTLALILAEELGVTCRITSAPALERPRDIIGLLVNLKPRELLFIDEIHRLTRVAEELLYPAMEDMRIDLTVGKGMTSRLRSIDLAPFTLVGATTRLAAMSSPLRDRFGLIQRLDFYDSHDLHKIVQRTSKMLQLPLTEKGSLEIGRRCRGTPRIANRLLRRVRDYATVKGYVDVVDEDLVDEALSIQSVDDRGLDSIDRRLLNFLIDDHAGGPVGLETLAASLGEDPATLECVIEPFLLQIGFLQRTPRGRIVTDAARTHLELMSQK